MCLTWVCSLGWEDLLEEGMATTPVFLPAESPWTEEPGRLQSIGSQRVRRDWVTFNYSITIYGKTYPSSFELSLHLCWGRQWHPTPVLLPGKSHGRRSLVGCSPWGREESDTLSNFTFTFHFHALEKEMATHSNVLAWRIPGTGEPGGLPSMGSHRVRYDSCALAAAASSPLSKISSRICVELFLVFLDFYNLLA